MARVTTILDARMARRKAADLSSVKETIAARLSRARQRHFVGRAAEQSLWRQALTSDEPPFVVLWLFGPGGTGKTTLVERLASIAAAEGVTPVQLDARHLVGSADAFLGLLRRSLGPSTGDDVLASLHDGTRRALLIDTAEELGPLESWLRNDLVPRLPSDCLVVFAGRAPPEPDWRAEPGWNELLRVLSLRNLAPHESCELLRSRGIDEREHAQVLRATHGHPLALSLVADLLQQGADVDAEIATRSPDVVAALLGRFTHNAPDDAHRLALYTAAHLRVTDEAVLRHGVDPVSAKELYDWLASLSFSEIGPDGLYLHDLAAEALDVEFRRRDPDRYVVQHKRLREPCIKALSSTTGMAQHRAATDFCWMHRYSPVLGPVIDWPGARALSPAALTPSDHAPILEATRRFEGEAAADAIRFWLDRQPEAFTVVHASPTRKIGFIMTLFLESIDDAIRSADPRVALAFDTARTTAPLRPGETICLEQWIDYETYMAPGRMVSQVSTRSIRAWFGRGTAWSFYLLGDALELWEPVMIYLEHHPGPKVRLGSTEYTLCCHDWRAMPPSTFFEIMAEREILGGAGGAVSARNRAPALIVLSQEEFASAVRQALRDYATPDALAHNPLNRCRVAFEAPAPGGLRGALEAAVEHLSHSGKDEKMFGILKVTYLDPARTQEEAAELLNLSFSTYRRHLAAGVERTVDWLWRRELHGFD